MSMNYAPDIRTIGPYYPAPEGWAEKEWHQAAASDTRESHILAGRLYVVQCLWCTAAFAAPTKAEAMEMFRAHEAHMNGATS